MNLTKTITKIFLFFTLIFFMSACGKTELKGKYKKEGDPNDYLYFLKNNNYILHEEDSLTSMNFDGRYELKGSKITFISSRYGITMGRIEGNTIIDEKGNHWIKH